MGWLMGSGAYSFDGCELSGLIAQCRLALAIPRSLNPDPLKKQSPKPLKTRPKLLFGPRFRFCGGGPIQQHLLLAF